MSQSIFLFLVVSNTDRLANDTKSEGNLVKQGFPRVSHPPSPSFFLRNGRALELYVGSLVLCSCRLFLRLRYWYELCSASHSKGANDVANAFATSVGSGALSLRSAILIAAVMEFFGAFLLGGNVATTITKNITNAELYSDKPEVLMLGMMCVVLGVAMWLILATIYSLPVSTTHS